MIDGARAVSGRRSPGDVCVRPETTELQEGPAISGAQYVFIRPSVSITHSPALGLGPGRVVDPRWRSPLDL